MIDRGKHNVLGVMVDVVDYEAAVARIIGAAKSQTKYSCTALAVHGVMTGVLDPVQRYRLNAIDLVTPDGQPVRWGLNSLHDAQLADRVYGPKLMLELCEAAAADALPIYLYGAREDVVDKLSENLRQQFSGLEVAGAEPSIFRPFSAAERENFYARVETSGASLIFVGLGCPRQEVFAYECADRLGLPIVSVGAAFDYHAGTAKEPPPWVQRTGLQWAHRLVRDPRRLWKRYIGLSSLYVLLFGLQRFRAWRPSPSGKPPVKELMYG